MTLPGCYVIIMWFISQLWIIRGLREEIEIYNVGPRQGADIIIFRFINIDLSTLLTEIVVPPHCPDQSTWFAAPAGRGFSRIFPCCPAFLYSRRSDWLTDWLILIKLFVVDKLICPSVTHLWHGKHCSIVKIQTIALISSMNHLHDRSHTLQLTSETVEPSHWFIIGENWQYQTCLTDCL